MIATIMPDNFEKYGLYKYICFAGGIVNFCNAVNHHISHKHVVDEHPHLKALSAGTISVYMKKWKITDDGSETAKLKRLPTDEVTIDNVLKPYGFHPKEQENESGVDK